MTPAATEVADRLTTGTLTVIGQVQGSSNVVVVVEADGLRAVHKPIAGEAPLWDFADDTLALRERATWLVDSMLGWGLVPVTVLRDGPWGPGSLQAWVETDPEQPLVDVVAHGHPRAGWLHVLTGEDGDGNAVDVVHRDTPALRRMALLDVVTNNSDRKGGHVLTGPDGEPRGIDHGLTFHVDPKLRTVLWGWVGEPLNADEVAALEGLRASLEAPNPSEEVLELHSLLSPEEYAATVARTLGLLHAKTFPEPDGRWPSVPWPPF